MCVCVCVCVSELVCRRLYLCLGIGECVCMCLCIYVFTESGLLTRSEAMFQTQPILSVLLCEPKGPLCEPKGPLCEPKGPLCEPKGPLHFAAVIGADHLLRWGDEWCNGWHACFPSLPPMLGCGFKSQLGLDFSDFGRWHFLKFVVKGFLWLLRFTPLHHRLMVQPIINRIKLK